MLPTRVLSAQAQIRCEATPPVTASHSQFGGPMIKLMPGSRAILLLLTGVTWTSLAGAQAGTIGGTITDARSGLPISDASIVVEGSTPVARSGTRGELDRKSTRLNSSH